MTTEQKMVFLLKKMNVLASAIYVFIDSHEISPEFFEFAKHIDWVVHFEDALREFNKMPEAEEKGGSGALMNLMDARGKEKLRLLRSERPMS